MQPHSPRSAVVSPPDAGVSPPDAGPRPASRGVWTRGLALGLSCLLATSCVTSNLPPMSAAGSDFEPLRDERALWRDARIEEEALLEEVALYDDLELEAYLEDVLQTLEPPSLRGNRQIDWHVYIVDDPTLNAFAYPHGAIFVHTGLLARLETEDQLAAVLAHEMTHVENRHMLRFRRSAQNRELAISAVALAAAIWISHEADDAWSEGKWRKAAGINVLGDLFVGLGLQLALLASVNGYGRDLEFEADEGAFEKLARAGYDAGEVERLYEILQEDHGDPRDLEVFFFGSHPQLSRRAEEAREWLAEAEITDSVTGSRASAEDDAFRDERFAERIAAVVREDARANLEAGRPGVAEAQIERASAFAPGDPELVSLRERLDGLTSGRGDSRPRSAEEPDDDPDRDLDDH